MGLSRIPFWLKNDSSRLSANAISGVKLLESFLRNPTKYHTSNKSFQNCNVTERSGQDYLSKIIYSKMHNLVLGHKLTLIFLSTNAPRCTKRNMILCTCTNLRHFLIVPIHSLFPSWQHLYIVQSFRRPFLECLQEWGQVPILKKLTCIQYTSDLNILGAANKGIFFHKWQKHVFF